MSRVALVVLAALGLTVAGCSATYQRTTIDQISGGDGVVITLDAVDVPLGQAATAHVVPYNSDDKPMNIDVRSHDPTALEIDRGQGDDQFAFLGVKEGDTQVDFLADGILVASAKAHVQAR